MNEKKIYRLENWSISTFYGYHAPEQCYPYLQGNVYGDPTFADGTGIITSVITGRKGKIIRTYTGSLYELGAVNSEYEKLFPNAYERLMKSMPEPEASAKEQMTLFEGV